MKYLLKKIGLMLLTLLIVSMCVFLAFHLIPGDPALRILGTNATPEQAEALRKQMGLSDPLYAQYARWLGSLLHGDMGTSYVYHMPVAQLLSGKLLITLSLSLLSFALMLLVSLPLGIYTAKYVGGMADRIVMVVNQIIMAVPPFFSGILLTWVFGLTLRLFVPNGFISYERSLGGFFSYLICPAVAIALPKAAMCTRLLRGCVIEEAQKDYVRTAYSRGNTIDGVLYRHVLKNALIPVITFVGMTLADMVANSIVIERVFGIPGISTILLTSISSRDYPVVEAIVMGLALMIIVINLAVDVIYRLTDPRIE